MFPCCQTNWDNFWYNKLHLKNLYILIRTVYWLKLSFFNQMLFFFFFVQILNSLQDCQLFPFSLEILHSRQLFNIYILAINESFIIVLHKIINSLLLFTMQLMSKHFILKVKTRISHMVLSYFVDKCHFLNFEGACIVKILVKIFVFHVYTDQ